MSSPSPERLRRAKLLQGAGFMLLPVGLALGAGYLLSERGVRLVPTMLGLMLLLSVAALGLLLAAAWVGGTLRDKTDPDRPLRTRMVVILVAVSVGLVGRLALWTTEDPCPLTALPPAEFETAFSIDLGRLNAHARGLDTLVARVEKAIPPSGTLSPGQEEQLVQSWAAFRDYALALDSTRRFYEDYYRFDPGHLQRTYHLRSFLLSYAAELTVYEKMARFAHAVEANPNAKKFLDAPHPAFALRADSFGRARQDLLGARDQARVIAGRGYLDVFDETFGQTAAGGEVAKQMNALRDTVSGRIRRIEKLGLVTRAKSTARADLQLFKRHLRRTWFPVQKDVAERMGDIRVRRIGWYLIKKAEQEKAAALLEPGDVLMSRKNWYLSNVGLPGFWPHAMIYMGTPEQFSAYFDDPGVLAWVEEQAGKPMTFQAFVSSRYPTAYAAFEQREHHEPMRLMEAISEGVVFSTLGHAAGDYFAGLRPRLDKKAKAQAMVAAFRHFNKPYDFDFDFATDHALVCTELVWRSYRSAEGKAGIDMPLIHMAGRETLPANDIARLFTEQRSTPTRLFDFVVFVDAEESKRRAFLSDEDAFAATFERPKWDIVQR